MTTAFTAYHTASEAYRIAVKAYRARQIGDAEFLAARKARDNAMA
jgi:hypothetical protein